MAIHTIDELLRDTAAKHPDATILSYFSDVTKSETYSASDLNLMSQRCALWYSKVLPKIRKSSDDAPLVVAILGPTNVEYIATYLALQRLGITVLFLSTRLAPPAYLHLFQKTKSNVVIAQPAFQTVMSQTKELMNGDLTVIPMLDHSYITTPNADDSSSLPCSIDPAKEYNRLGWIIHSSGSVCFAPSYSRTPLTSHRPDSRNLSATSRRPPRAFSPLGNSPSRPWSPSPSSTPSDSTASSKPSTRQRHAAFCPLISP